MKLSQLIAKLHNGDKLQDLQKLKDLKQVPNKQVLILKMHYLLFNRIAKNVNRKKKMKLLKESKLEKDNTEISKIHYIKSMTAVELLKGRYANL